MKHNLVYERRYLGNGVYYQRGHNQDIKVGCSITWRLDTLSVKSIESQRDAKGVFENPDDAINAAYEATMVDNTFTNEVDYKPFKNVGL